MWSRPVGFMEGRPPSNLADVEPRATQGRRPWLFALGLACATLGRADAGRVQAEAHRVDVFRGAAGRAALTPLRFNGQAFAGVAAHTGTWFRRKTFVPPRLPPAPPPEVYNGDTAVVIDRGPSAILPEVSVVEPAPVADVALPANDVALDGAQETLTAATDADDKVQEAARGDRPAPSHWPAAWRADLTSVEFVSETLHAAVYYATLRPSSTLSPSRSGRVMVKEIKVLEHNSEVVLTKRKDVKALREIAIVKKFSGGAFLAYVNSTTPEEWALGAPMLLMTEAPTGTLKDLVMAKTMRQVPFATRMRLLIQLLRAMDIFHGKGFAFRDLRPEHIYIVGDCEDTVGPKCKLKLGDLSSAVGLPGRGVPFEQVLHEDLRDPHVYAAGREQYWPPEMLRGEDYDPLQQDAYSVGLLMHRMLRLTKGRGITYTPFRVIANFFLRRRAVPEAAILRVKAVRDGLLQKYPEYREPVWEALEELESVARSYKW